jgi:aquaporin related protein
MAGSGTYPHYYNQQLEDGTMMESPPVPRHYSSRNSRRQLLQAPDQAYLDHTIAPIESLSPMPTSEAFGLTAASTAPQESTTMARPRGYSNPNAYGPPGQAYDERAAAEAAEYYRHMYEKEKRNTRRQSRAPTQRNPYIEDHSDSDSDHHVVHRRRPSRHHKRPPAAYERYGPVTGRASLDAHPASRFSEDGSISGDKAYRMYYDSDRNTPRRRLYAAATGESSGRKPPSTTEVMRLPWTMWMNSSAKNHFVAFVGEFVGTTMFLFFAFAGTQVANIGSSASPDATNTTTGEATGFSPMVLLYVSVVFGFSLMVNVWVFFRISGGLFNPAVTLAMLLCRAISPVRATLLLVAQLSGSIFSSFVVSVLFPTNFNVRTTLSSGTGLVRGVFIEAVLTAELVFTIFMLAKEKHKGRAPPSHLPKERSCINTVQQPSSPPSASASPSSSPS